MPELEESLVVDTTTVSIRLKALIEIEKQCHSVPY